MRLSLKVLLRAKGYAVSAVASAEEALLDAQEEPPHLALVDWNLPGESGLWLLGRWQGVRWPTILLSARHDVADRVAALDAGAGDYLVKPFVNEELLARIRVQLRTGPAPSNTSELDLSGVHVDLRREVATRDGSGIPLTTKEVELLRFFAANPSRPISREELLREVWGYRTLRSRALDNTMLRLRGKLERDPGQPRHLLTVHGVGYRFEP